MFTIGHCNVSSHAKEFADSGFTYFDDLIDQEHFAGLRAQVDTMLKGGSMRRDFAMAETHGSPRKMSVVNGHALLSEHFFADLYFDRKLLELLNELTDTKVAPCDNEVESMIITSLNEVGDTHGWHTDDYPFALIIGIESAAGDAGGGVEFIDYQDRLRSAHLKTGDAYLMRTDRIAHRVTPLLCHATRTILNLTYSIQGLSVVPNGTAQKLLT